MGNKEGRDIPGDAVGSQALFERRLVQGASDMVRMEQSLHRLWENGVEVRGLSMRAPQTAGGDWLVVVRADKDGSASVAFVSDASFWDVLRKFAAMCSNQSLKWRDDEYAK